MAEEFKNVPEHETPNIATEESSETTTTPEVKDRGMFDFMKKKEEVKPQETPLESDFEHKAQISEPAFVTKHEEEENKENTHTTLLEKLHQAHEEEEENKPNLLQKLHRSNSSSSSSSDEEEKDGEKKKKEKKKKIVEGEEEKKGLVEKVKEKLPGHKEEYVPVVGVHVEGEERSEEEKKGIMDKIKEKLPAGHGNKPEDDVSVVVGEPVTIPAPADPSVVEHSEEHPVEKKGILEKIKEKLPGFHAKSSGEEEMKVKESD